MTEDQIKQHREAVIHGLRSGGWSRIEAENEADDRIDRLLHPSTPSPEQPK